MERGQGFEAPSYMESTAFGDWLWQCGGCLQGAEEDGVFTSVWGNWGDDGGLYWCGDTCYLCLWPP